MSPSYKTRDPKGWCGDPARGAALGRPSVDVDDPEAFGGPIEIRRVPIDKGGYDPNGTYFGTGRNLYWIASRHGSVDKVERHADAQAALAATQAHYPHALVALKPELAVSVGDVELDGFTRSYLECALWCTSDLNSESDASLESQNYDLDDFAVETLMQAKRDCEDFQEAQAELLAKAYERPWYDEENAGHDFWLTRNGHGAGFWDRGLGEIGDALSDACDPYGGVDLYVGDDGKIHD